MYDVISSLLDDPSFKAKVKHTAKQYNANEKILTQGVDHSGIYLIKAGTVRVIVNAEIKENSVLKPGIADLGINDVFGEFGLFDDLPASADVIALVDCELLEIDIPSFKLYLDEHPEVGYRIFNEMLKTLVKRLRHADKTILNLYTWGMKAHQLDKHL